MATEAENLATLQLAYAQVLANILAAELAAGPDVSVDGVSIQDGAYLSGLYARLAQLQKIPGVAQLPIFEVVSQAR